MNIKFLIFHSEKLKKKLISNAKSIYNFCVTDFKKQLNNNYTYANINKTFINYYGKKIFEINSNSKVDLMLKTFSMLNINENTNDKSLKKTKSMLTLKNNQFNNCSINYGYKIYAIIKNLSITENYKTIIDSLNLLNKCQSCSKFQNCSTENCSNIYNILTKASKYYNKCSTILRKIYLIKEISYWLIDFDFLLKYPNEFKLNNLLSKLSTKV